MNAGPGRGRRLLPFVDRLVLVSTPFRRSGWYPEMTAGMDAMGPEIAEPFKQTPMYADYQRIAPRVDDWPILFAALGELLAEPPQDRLRLDR